MVAERDPSAVRGMELGLRRRRPELLHGEEGGTQVADEATIDVDRLVHAKARHGPARVSICVVGLLGIDDEAVRSEDRGDLGGQKVRSEAAG